MNTTKYVVLGHVLENLISIRMTNHKQVVDVTHVVVLHRQHNISVFERLAIPLSNLTTLIRPSLDVLHLYQQHGGLHGVQTTVVSQHIVAILDLLTVVTQQAKFLSQLVRVSHDRSTVTVST